MVLFNSSVAHFLTAGLDLWTLTFWLKSRGFPLNPPKAKLFAGGSTATKTCPFNLLFELFETPSLSPLIETFVTYEKGAKQLESNACSPFQVTYDPIQRGSLVDKAIVSFAYESGG